VVSVTKLLLCVADGNNIFIENHLAVPRAGGGSNRLPVKAEIDAAQFPAHTRASKH